MHSGHFSGSLAELIRCLKAMGDTEHIANARRHIAEVYRLRDELRQRGEAEPVAPASIVIDLSAESTRQEARQRLANPKPRGQQDVADMGSI
jgi:hypothetical protein